MWISYSRNLCIMLATVLMKETSQNIVFFGHNPNDQHMMMSTVSYSFDHHRKVLGSLMKEVDSVILKMDDLDAKNGRRRSIHDEFRSAAMQLPPLWEANEDVLHYLVNPHNMPLKYAINGPRDVSLTEIERGEPLFENDEGKETRSRDEFKRDNISRSAMNIPSYDTMEQVLVHLSRDWSKRGELVRKHLYEDGFLSTLSALIDDPIGKRVLVPGAGLGRLAAELAVKGFSVEANECSAVMTSAMHTLFQKVLPTNCMDQQITMYPHISPNLMDNWDFSARLQPVSFPSPDSRHIANWLRGNLAMTDIANEFDRSCIDSKESVHGEDRLRGVSCSDDVIGEVSCAADQQAVRDTKIVINSREDEIVKLDESSKGSLSVQFGDFAAVYSHADAASSFDVVVTCFFIDTAADVADYIDVIAHVLKAGGLWLNAGPLHYHSKQSVPYSHSQLVAIVRQSGFEVVSQAVVPSTSYCGEEGLSMKPEYYDVPLDVFRLRHDYQRFQSDSHATDNVSPLEHEREIDELIWRRPDLKLP